MKRLLLVSFAVIGLAAPLVAQQGIDRLGGELGPRYADPAQDKLPVPKLADGTPDFSGVWRDGGGDPKPEVMDPLLLPWAKQVLSTRKPQDNPYFQCMPAGPLRMVQLIAPARVAEHLRPATAPQLMWAAQASRNPGF